MGDFEKYVYHYVMVIFNLDLISHYLTLTSSGIGGHEDAVG